MAALDSGNAELVYCVRVPQEGIASTEAKLASAPPAPRSSGCPLHPLARRRGKQRALRAFDLVNDVGVTSNWPRRCRKGSAICPMMISFGFSVPRAYATLCARRTILSNK